MDAMTLFNSLSMTSNASQLAGNAANSGNGTVGSGEGDFQKQLLNVMGTQDANKTVQGTTAPTATVAESEVADLQLTELIASETNALVQSMLLANNASQISSEELTEEGLDAIIEQLLDQLDQLTDADLTEEQQNMLASLLQQISALVALILGSNHGAKQEPSFDVAHLIASADMSFNSKETINKLSDQLLVLQQALQTNANKVIFGQSANSLLQDQLQVVQAKLNELLSNVKQKSNEQANSQQEIVVPKLTSDSNVTNHLQRLTQEASFNPVAQKVAELNTNIAVQAVQSGQTSQATAATQVVETVQAAELTQPVQASNAETVPVQTALPDFHLKADNAKDFLLQLSRSTSGSTSAYVIADEFAETMKELVVQRFNISNLNGVTEAKISLTPEHLGQVDVKLSVQNGVLTAIFQTETAMAKDALENQILQLRTSLAQQGITVEKIEISQSELASGLNQGQKQRSSGNQQGQEQSGSGTKEETFEEELLINVASQQLGFGRAVNEIV